MKHSPLWLCFWLLGLQAGAQALYTSEASEVRFFSDAPLEDIEAVNKNAQSVLNAVTREIAVKIPVTSFVFPNALMQEHFNENYLESEKFPYATFRGTINEAVDPAKPGTYAVSATGRLAIHGQERDRTLKGRLTIQPGTMTLEAAFDVLLADHAITVPKMVFTKIAEKIAVTAKFSYRPYQKKPR